MASGVRRVILVEGVSDLAALTELARRRGRDLRAEGIALLAMGGATNLGRYLGVLGPAGLDLEVGGLCDAGEEADFRRFLEAAGVASVTDRPGLEALGFFVCDADLEYELIRALGTDGTIELIEAEGDAAPWRTFQTQPHQRGRDLVEQLHRFIGTRGGRKEQYARAFVERLDLAAVPRPLDLVLGTPVR